jgi:hypothetical protein
VCRAHKGGTLIELTLSWTTATAATGELALGGNVRLVRAERANGLILVDPIRSRGVRGTLATVLTSDKTTMRLGGEREPTLACEGTNPATASEMKGVPIVR